MQCTNCGAELLKGQRFCRACGTASLLGEGGVEPTRMIDTDPEGLVKVNDTFRPAKADTNPVAHPANGQTSLMDAPQNSDTRLMDSKPLPQPTAAMPFATNYPQAQRPAQTNQSPHSSPFQVGQAAYTPPSAMPPAAYQSGQRVYMPPAGQAKNPYGWLIALGGIALVGVIFFAFLLFGRARSPRKITATTRPPVVAPPSNSSETYLDESAARVTDDETIFTQSFPLPNSAKFSLNNVSGDVKVEGYDGTVAEIKVIKRGGTAEERKEIKIAYSTLGGNLSIKTSQNFTNDIETIYEIRLPRNLGQVNIEAVSSKIQLADIDALLDVKSVSGDVDLSKIKGAVKAETQSGEIFLSEASGDISAKSTSGKIELANVSGSIKAVNVSGDLKATIDSAASSDSLSFESIGGEIDLRFKSEINAELTAKTISGSIDVGNLGIEVKEAPGSQQASGRLGVGGQPLSIKTVSGDIKIKKKS